jgi:hypothetical protein
LAISQYVKYEYKIVAKTKTHTEIKRPMAMATDAFLKNAKKKHLLLEPCYFEGKHMHYTRHSKLIHLQFSKKLINIKRKKKKAKEQFV